jgi:hypothetical protein
MAAIGSLWQSSSIYGCTLSSVDNRTCLNGAPDNTDATDEVDDWSRNEYVNGAGIGTGGGIKELCGLTGGNTGGLTVDIARGSRVAKSTEVGGVCPNGPTDLQYADDSITGMVFPFTNRTALTCGLSGGTGCATQIGPVAAGWVPGDPLAGPYTRAAGAFTDISNTETSPGAGSISSIARRLWCSTSTPNTSADAAPWTGRINDWGQLTDPTVDNSVTLTQLNGDGTTQTYHPTLGQEGRGAPIAEPIYIPSVNVNSGTKTQWDSFIGCNGNNNADGNTLQENNAPQLQQVGLRGGTFTMGGANAPTATSCTANDNICAGNLVVRSIYFMSYGVSVWKPYTTFRGQRTTINSIAAGQGQEVSTCVLANGCVPLATHRNLHNFYNPQAVRASVAGFLNWICDTDLAKVHHGTDITSGKNYNDELGNLIGTQFFFPREDCGILPASAITDPNT